MRMQKRKIAVVVLAVLTGSVACALADVAATVDSSAITWVNTASEQCIGWRFFVDREITITHVGIFDQGDNGLASPHVIGIIRCPKEGGFVLERQVDIGPGGATEDHHVFVALSEPLRIVPDPVPSPAGNYERWLVGVYSGAGNTDGLIIRPQSAVTLNVVHNGIIRLQNYTYRGVPSFPGVAPYYWYPWGSTSDLDYFGVNFKYTVPGPQAEAGPDVEIYTSEQALTTIAGVATHTNPGTAMQYRWLEGGTVLQGWTDVSVFGTANLDLAAPVPAFSIGAHTLTLELTDSVYTASDTMTLTVVNTPPDAQPSPTSQTLEIGADAIVIAAQVADFDGDTISYQWLKEGEVLYSGTATPPAGGGLVDIPDLVIAAGDPRFSLGSSEVRLAISDSVNPPETYTTTVVMQDTTAPTLAPTPSTTMLWPANHVMVPVTIWTNTEDNGGGFITLSASVESSEPLDGAGDGSTEEDCVITSVDSAAGMVLVQLRAERSGTGDGRVYTITITAADLTGNQSTATVDVRVPHDKKKK
jgi:hypothetical protein